MVLRERCSSQRDGREFDVQYRDVGSTLFVPRVDAQRLGEREALKAAVARFKEQFQ